MANARDWIDRLRLSRHPEGGWFRETYRSAERIAAAHLPPRFGGDRAFSTAIYYLLEAGDFSALHRIHQEEVWHFYDGAPLALSMITPDGAAAEVRLGRDPDRGELPQAVVQAGWLFGAAVAASGGYSLCGCTVAPGFDFADFEMPPRAELRRLYPQHRDLIDRLTR